MSADDVMRRDGFRSVAECETGVVYGGPQHLHRQRRGAQCGIVIAGEHTDLQRCVRVPPCLPLFAPGPRFDRAVQEIAQHPDFPRAGRRGQVRQSIEVERRAASWKRHAVAAEGVCLAQMQIRQDESRTCRPEQRALCECQHGMTADSQLDASGHGVFPAVGRRDARAPASPRCSGVRGSRRSTAGTTAA